MFYAIHDDDGRITQANKVFDSTGYGRNPKSYDQLLHEHDLQFAKNKSNAVLSPDKWWVTHRQLALRPVMPIVVSKTTIQAGDNDAVIFTRIPKGAQFRAMTGGFAFQEETIPVTRLEYSVPVPCVCRVTFDLWPFQTFSVDIEVVA